MSKWLQNTRSWLGLAEENYDDYSDDYDDGYDDDVDDVNTWNEPEEPVARPSSHRGTAGSPVRPLQRDFDEGDGGVRVIHSESSDAVDASRGVVRTLPASKSTKPEVVVPTSFNDVQLVADHFMNDQPVIMNLQSAPREISRRLIDFASGLCYGLSGQMERVAENVFLLTPTGAEVSDEDRKTFH